MDLACVDRLAKDIKGVKFLLSRQDSFDRTIDSKLMKTKKSKETVGAFLNMITKRNRPRKNWVDNGTDFTGEFRLYCSA